MKLTINDTEYTLKWGIGAIEIYCDEMDCDLDGLDQIFTQSRTQGKAIANIILAAVKNDFDPISNCPVTYRNIQDLLDGTSVEQLSLILKDWYDSKYLGKTVSTWLGMTTEETKPDKKKSKSVKSSNSVTK